ncbi:RNA-dependent RNA polymerase [Erysiphe necator associated virus 6]|nr:RNA-dependent RNA polymerase [Erysiphe necator associated virus 6]
MPGPLRATRGEQYRHQPTKRFGLNVKTRLHDGNALARGERVGTSQQGYLGPVIEGLVPYITTTSRADFLSAFNKRANYHSDGRMDKVCRAISRGMIRRLVPVPMPTIEWDVELYRDWLALFDNEKQGRMEKAYHSLGLESLSGYSNKGIFTKIECLVKEFHEVAPRVIFKGTDVYNMISGPMFKALMDRFVLLGDELDNVKFRVSYRQHTPEIVTFLEEGPKASFLEADFSSNDKSQVKDVIELECMFIRRLGAPKWFVDLHRKTNKFSVHNSKYGLSAVVENQLPSGATDGTFRNSFWNLCIYNCWSRLYKVPPARIVLLGDDILAALTKRVRRSARHYISVASRCHMVAKVTTHRRLSDAHFLSKHFYPVCRGENGHVMMPFIGKILAKFNARPNSNEGVTDDEYMAGKALSHCYEFRYCHRLRDMFRDRANLHLQRSGGRFSVEGVTWHVRVHSAYSNEIEQMLLGSMEWEDLVLAEDLTSFWLDHYDLTYVDVEPTLKAVILEDSYRVLDHVAARQLVDY